MQTIGLALIMMAVILAGVAELIRGEARRLGNIETLKEKGIIQ